MLLSKWIIAYLALTLYFFKLQTFLKTKPKAECLEFNFSSRYRKPNSENLLLRLNTLAFGRPLLHSALRFVGFVVRNEWNQVIPKAK